MRWLVMLVLCGGCRQLFGITSPDHLEDAAPIGDGIAIDGPIDAPVDTPPGSFCYGTGFGRVCFLAPPQGNLTLQQAIATDTSNQCDTTNAIGASSWCVIAATNITINGTVAATGTKPLVLIATNTIAIAGNLDVSSRRGAQTGAGSATGATLCDAGTVGVANGGGAGGSFGTAGGRGGNNGGTAGVTKPAAMRGGCPGQDGRSGTPGQHGVGGGAVYLIAGTLINVSGKINASGGGGSGGVNGSGGAGGGGSGGLIAFDAPSVMMNGALIIANGAGGGEGADATSTGNPGGESTGGIALGGTGGTGTGGDGGDGAAMAAGAGSGGNGAGGAGGGGGGGGVGVIAVFQAPSISGTGTVSPPPS